MKKCPCPFFVSPFYYSLLFNSSVLLLFSSLKKTPLTIFWCIMHIFSSWPQDSQISLIFINFVPSQTKALEFKRREYHLSIKMKWRLENFLSAVKSFPVHSLWDFCVGWFISVVCCARHLPFCHIRVSWVNGSVDRYHFVFYLLKFYLSFCFSFLQGWWTHCCRAWQCHGGCC